MPVELLAGTHNPARIDLIRAIVSETGVRLRTLDEFDIHSAVPENGASTAENAAAKARAYFALTGIPTLAVDGGLHIERFPPEQQPGVRVKRQDGLPEDASPQAMLDFYRRALQEVGGQSPAAWTASNALALSADELILEDFSFQVIFTARPFGQPIPGLVLDPLMIDPASGLYYTQMPLQQRPYYQLTAAFLLRHLPRLY